MALTLKPAMDLANRLTLGYMTGIVGTEAISILQDAATIGTLGPYSSSIERVLDLMAAGDSASALEAAAILNEIGPVILNLGDDTQVEDPLAEAEEEETEVVQVPISETEFNDQFPDVNPSEYTESGTWTDPDTGVVYVINIPPVIVEPTEEEPGGGGAEAPTDVEGEPTADQPEEEEVIVDPTDSTVDDEDAETAETVPPDTTETEEPEEGAETGIPDFSA